MKINGLPVVNGKRNIKLIIQPKDITTGKVRDAGNCAAAKACMRQLHAQEAKVHLACTYLRFGKHWERYKTGAPLRSEFIAFDRGGEFAPGEYQLVPYPKTITPAKPKKRPSTVRSGPSGKASRQRRLHRHTVTGIRERAPGPSK